METTNTSTQTITLNDNQRSILITVINEEICTGESFMQRVNRILHAAEQAFPGENVPIIDEMTELTNELANIKKLRSVLLSKAEYDYDDLAWFSKRWKVNIVKLKENAQREKERYGRVSDVTGDQIDMFDKFTAVYGGV